MNYCNKEINLSDLQLNAVGEQYCPPGHFNGPKIRENYLFHFIFSGKGIFRTHEKTYHLSANQGFFIGDSSPIYYKADENDPWHYGWIQIEKNESEKFFKELSLSPESPIYTAKQNNNIYEHFKNLLESMSQAINYETIAYLLKLFSALTMNNVLYKEQLAVPNYIQQAEQYILNYYHSNTLRISDIAYSIGIDRSYLSRLFADKFGLSPQKYLLQTRMEKAKFFLETTIHPINIVATSVGYPYIYAFSKTFKKYYGLSPSQMRSSKT